MKKLFSNNMMILLFLASFVVVLVVSIAASHMMISSASLVEESIRDQMVALSEGASLLVTAEELDEFMTVEDMEKPEYQRLKQRLSNFTEQADILFTYYMRLDTQTNQMQFIIDNVMDPADEPDGLDSAPLDREEGPDIALGGQSYVMKLGDYSEGWDGLLTAWAPMYYSDGELSNIVAGVDIQDIYTQATRRNSVALTAVLIISNVVVLIAGLAALMLYRRKAREFEIASEAKSSFLSRMSHEMRTPMNAIVGMSEILLREDIPASSYKHAVGIKQASANLLSIINDVLDLSKIESGKMEIINARYQFASMVNDIVNIIRMRVIGKPVRFLTYIDAALPSVMEGDEVHIRQVLINLLGNAAKYTEEGFISLSVTGKLQGDGKILLRLDIMDSGIGIKPEDQKKLFGSFVQVNVDETKGVEGTGLGLSIARTLTIAMDGEISLVSEYGKGSTFTMEVPQKILDAEPLARVKDAEKKNILLYEMRELDGESMGRSFETLGLHYTWVRSQADFLAEMEKNGQTYTHLFLPYVMMDSLSKLKDGLPQGIKVVAIADDDTGHLTNKNMELVQMPVHAISVANVINEESTLLQYADPIGGTGFTAPDARVLLVDDINTNLTVAEGLLAPYHMQVDKAKSGREAVEMVKENHYDIVFMDHMMPGMDGLEATEAIRGMGDADEYFKNLPIVAMTANAVSGMKEMFLQNGMDDYLSKPIEIPKLAHIMDKWIPQEKRRQYVEEEQTEELPGLDIPGVDEKTGLAMAGGSAQAYQRILQTFYADGQQKLHEIAAALREEDIGLYTTYVHALKSALASIGAKDLSAQARELEMAGQKEDMQVINDGTGSFLKGLESLLVEIGKKIDTKDLPKEAGDTAVLQDMVRQLQTYLEELDIEESDKLLAELLSKKWDGETERILRQVESDILVARFDEAAELLGKLL